MLATVDLALNYCKTNYESKLDSSKSGTLHRAFIKQPSKEELRSFFIDEVRGKIVDGSYSLNGYYWDDNLYNDSIKETILSVYRRLLKSPLLDRIMLEEIKNDLCNYLS